MENLGTNLEKQAEKTAVVEILGSTGFVYQSGEKTIWNINGTEKEPHVTEPVWPILADAIERVCRDGQSEKIDQLRISPAVALHMVFEGFLSNKHLDNAKKTDVEMAIENFTISTPDGDVTLRLVVEKNMLQNREGVDIMILDEEGHCL